MFVAATIGLLVTLTLVLIRALLGPTVYDRILAVNGIGTLTVLLLATHGFLMGRPEFLDIAMVYALINFIGTIAVTKYVKYSSLGHPEQNEEGGDL